MQAPKVNRMPALLRVDFLLPSPRVKDIDTAWSVIRKSGSRFSEAIMLHERGGNRFTLPIAALGPCGGTGRRARLKIVFRKEWGFDSLHGHHMTYAPRALHHTRRAAVELPPRWRVSGAH